MEVLYRLSYAGVPTLVLTKNGAGNEARTRDPQLGRLTLYQLSYSRSKYSQRFRAKTGREAWFSKWWWELDLNQRRR